jgi:DNA-binding beta-propeller fold protein YncE
VTRRHLALALAFVLALACGKGAEERVTTFRAGRPLALAVDGKRLWVADDENSFVRSFSSSTGKEIDNKLRVAHHPVALAVGGSNLWVAHTDGTITRIDRRSGRSRAMKAGRSIADIAFLSGTLWAADAGSGELMRIDPSRMTVIAKQKSVKPVRMIAAADHVWITTESDTLLTYSDRGVRTGSIKTGRGPVGLASDGRVVWIANSDDGTVTRVDARKGRVIGKPIRVGRGPSSIAIASGSVWVSNHDERTIARIDARTARVLESAIALDSSVIDVDAAGRTLWVAGTDPARLIRVR